VAADGFCKQSLVTCQSDCVRALTSLLINLLYRCRDCSYTSGSNM